MFRVIGQFVASSARPVATFSTQLSGLKSGLVRSTHSAAAGVDLAPLKTANQVYAIFQIHNRPYLVTRGDKVVLPFNLKQAEIGDVLNLNDVTTLGTRNFKLVDRPIDPSLYTMKATVVAKTKSPLTVREVTKRRNRKVRHAVNKHDLTVLRITELQVHGTK